MHFPIDYQSPMAQGRPLDNHQVSDEDLQCVFVNTHRCPHRGPVISSPRHTSARQSVNQHWMQSHPVQYSFRSDPKYKAIWGVPQSQHNYSSTQHNNAFISISNGSSAARHGSQCYEPLLGSINSSPPDIGNNHIPSDILQMQSPNGYASYSPLSHIVDEGDHASRIKAVSAIPMPFVDSLHGQQNAVPQSCSPPYPLSFSGHPPLALESSQFRTEVGLNYSHHSLCYPIRPPINQPNSIPIPVHNGSFPQSGECDEAAKNPSPTSLRSISCLWLLDGTPCGFTGSLDVLKTHCKSTHFPGPDNVQFKCRWKDCDYHKRDDPTVDVMRRDSMWRHLYEVHLGGKRST